MIPDRARPHFNGLSNFKQQRTRAGTQSSQQLFVYYTNLDFLHGGRNRWTRAPVLVTPNQKYLVSIAQRATS